VKWQKGQSGNPAGRPKGSKNKISLVKSDLELSLREFSKRYVPHVLAKALEMALNGDRSMIKLLLELHMSKPQHHDSDESGKNQVQILVQNLTTKGGELAVGVKTPPPHSPVSIEAKVLSLNGDNDGKTDSSGNDRNSEEHPQEHSSAPEACPIDGEQ
jgi:hypothetical protein